MIQDQKLTSRQCFVCLRYRTRFVHTTKPPKRTATAEPFAGRDGGGVGWWVIHVSRKKLAKDTKRDKAKLVECATVPEDVEKIVIRHKREGTRCVWLAARHWWLVPANGPVAEIGPTLLRIVVHAQLVKVSGSTTRRRMSPFMLRYRLLAWTR